MKRAAVLLALASLLYAAAARADKIDPSFRFRTVETEHFSIHYHDGVEDAAGRVAGFAEDAHAKLSEAFRWSPREKTQVVLVDRFDIPNGYSTALPYNAIYIFPVPPSIDLTIGEYDDWLRSVFIHEYAHVLTNDPVRGYSAVMRKIFGKTLPSENLFSLLLWLFTAPPNTFLPSWWHEGMATWAETEFSTRGRGRSAYYAMIFRMAVEDNTLPSVDQVNEYLPYWPDGHFPYLYGLRMQKFIADRYGKGALADLSAAHSGRAPYFIGQPPEGVSDGKNYKALYAEMLEALRGEERARIDALKAAPLTAADPVPLEGEILSHPRFSPDGKLLAVNRLDPHDHESIVVANADGSNARRVARRLPSDRVVAWAPDGGAIYFCQAEYTRGFNVYQDLYVHNLSTGRTRRLTTGLRLREPDVSPDGRSIAVVEGARGGLNLAILTRKDEAGDVSRGDFLLETVTNLSLSRVSNPRWSPDGGRIAYAAAGNAGRSGLYLYDTARKESRLLFEQDGEVDWPAWSPDGKYIVYASDRTGVYNLFAYDTSDGARRQVTHVLGGAFHPDVAAGKIVYSSYGGRGFRVASIDFDPSKWLASPGPSIPRSWEAAAGSAPDNAAEKSPAAVGAAALSGSKPYSALSTLYPRFWLPAIIGDTDEDVAAGALTAGYDVLGYHAYLLEAEVGADSHRVFYNAVYRYDRFQPSFRLQAYSVPVLYSDLMQRGGDYYENNRSAIAALDFPIPYLESAYRFSFGYHFQRQEALSDLVDGRFRGLPVFRGRRDNVFAAIRFSDALKYPYSISHEEGFDFSLEYRYYSTRLGSDLDSQEYVASGAGYFRIPSERARHHVLYAAAKAGISKGDRTVQQAFQIGGTPNNTLAGFPLRGYPSRFETGKYAATGTLEYRFPVWYVFRGPGTAPIFLDRLHGAAFVEAGEAWGDPESFSTNRLRVGAGLEARSDIDLGYYFKITPAVGVARGFNENGRWEAYFTIYANL